MWSSTMRGLSTLCICWLCYSFHGGCSSFFRLNATSWCGTTNATKGDHYLLNQKKMHWSKSIELGTHNFIRKIVLNWNFKRIHYNGNHVDSCQYQDYSIYAPQKWLQSKAAICFLTSNGWKYVWCLVYRFILFLLILKVQLHDRYKING